jgi:LysM repeat protein
MYWHFPIKLWQALSLVVILLLNGCPSAPVVEELPPSQSLPVIETPIMDTATYHTVERGETLYGVATRYGRDYKDVARWNNIPPPYALNPGQRLRIDGPSDGSFPTPTYTPGIPVVSPPPPISVPITSPSIPTPAAQDGTHIVQPGDTLSSVAKQYGYSFREVAEWNGIEPPYALSIGQILIVSPDSSFSPPSRPPSPEPVSPSGDENYHIVLPGDTLYKVAKHYGYSVVDVAMWNALEAPYSLSIGQQLRVSPPEAGFEIPMPTTPAIPALTPNIPQDFDIIDIQPKTEDKPGYHTVAPGDTLYQISQHYGFSIPQLADWNNLEAPYNLSLGQQLRVEPQAAMLPDLPPKDDYLRPVKLDTSPRHHIVQAGETLSNIAKQYGISWKDLAQWNGIGSPYTVYPGLNLTISPP